MEPFTTEHIRTVALVGDGAAGKTTLAEALLAKAGAIQAAGSVERGTTVSDFDPLEKQYQHSLRASLLHLETAGTRIHLIDTPGFPDFIGQSIGALDAVETAAVVISASAGPQMIAARMMEWAGERNLCRLVVINTWYCDSVDRYTMTRNLQPSPVTSAQARRPSADLKADKPRYYMLAHGSHLVDTARLLGGAIAGVRARLLEAFASVSWAVEVDFASGCLGHLNLVIPARGDFEEGVQIYGEYGSVQGRAYLPWYKKASEIECYSARDGLYRRPLGADSDTYKLQIEGFADTILRGMPQQGASIEDGVAAVRAMVAIARSVERGGAYVALAEVEGQV